MKTNFDLSSFLVANVKPALGCTEVVVIGLASSAAWLAAQNQLPFFLDDGSNKKNIISGDSPAQLLKNLKKIVIELDRNVFKNALAVNLPMPDSLLNKMEKGIEFAAALGIFSPLNKFTEQQILTLFSKITPKIVTQAKALKKQTKFEVKVVDSWTGKAELNVCVKLIFKDSSKIKFAEARITYLHTNFSYIANSDGVLYQNKKMVIEQSQINNQLEKLAKLSLKEMLVIIKSLPRTVQQLLKDNIALNTALSKKGLEGKHGLKLGQAFKNLISDKVLADDLVTYAKLTAAAAADARMGGAMKAAMSTAGSGNQGITATMPIIAVAEKIDANKLKISAQAQQQRLMQALTLSHLITSYVAHYSGHLSALCGCAVKAGIGAAAGVCYYLGGDEQKISLAINNMVANITGVICDGAKEGCALKLATASGTAVESALLAMRKVSAPLDNGILASTIEQTLQNIGKISDAMIKTDQVIVQETMLK